MLHPAQTEFGELLKTPELPDLGPGPRRDVLSEKELGARLESLFNSHNLPAKNKSLITSLLLLWHDHLDSSHSISQGIDGADGSFLHGIMHRREPDFSNAKYWFRHVGSHPSFDEIAKRAAPLDCVQKNALHPPVKIGQWDPFGFVDACQKAVSSNNSQSIDCLKQVQRIETEVLLERFLNT